MTITRVSGSLIAANTVTGSNLIDGTITSDDLSANVSVGSAGPTITTITYPGDDTAAIPTGGQTITLTGTNYAAGAYVIVGSTVVNLVTIANSTSLTFTSPAKDAGTYPILVVNSDGSAGISVPGMNYSSAPVWTTASGLLGLTYEYRTIDVSLASTSDSSLTYTLASGALPANTTLAANGLIYGVLGPVASAAVYNFTVKVTDAENQDTTRSFSLDISPDGVEWNTPANNSSYNIYTTIAISNVSLSAVSAAGFDVAYVANTLPAGLSLTGSTISGTPTATGNTTTLITATANVSNKSATRTLTWQSTVPFVANGGTITTVGGYKYHTFTSNDTFSILSGSKACDILLVGGGGAGCGTDGNGSGGGGAGGYLPIAAYSLGVGSHAIVIGSGGPASPDAGANGASTTFGTLFTALGGGGGGGRYPNEGGGTSQYGSNGRAGGSGGGGGFGHPGGAALQPSSTNGGFGNKGGDTTYVYSSSTGAPGAGGGGAGGAGGNAATSSPYTTPGNGGPGKQWLDGNYYAGGGGASTDAAVTQGTGGIGGGANGIRGQSGLSGTNGTGGGGGGPSGGGYYGGAGGSGIVIVRYAV